MKKLIFLFLMISVILNCGGKKKGMIPFLPLSSSGDGASAGQNANGEALPPPANTSTGAIGFTVSIAQDVIIGSQVPTSGPATVAGNVDVFFGDTADANFPKSSITIDLVDPYGNIIGTTTTDANGNYSIPVSNLANNNYQVVLPQGNGLNGTSANFSFVYDPTNSSNNAVVIPTLMPQERVFDSGAAIISGNVKTNGPILPSGPLPAGTPVTLYIQDPNGSITIDGVKYSQVTKGGSPVTGVTAADGSYSLDLTQSTGSVDGIDTYIMQSGAHYLVGFSGSTVNSSGRPFTDVYSPFTFYYNASKTDNSVVQNTDSGTAVSSWNPATSGQDTISGSIKNAVISGADMSGFTVKLLDGNGNVITSTTTNGSGNYSVSPTLNNGVYTVEISKTGYPTTTTSVSFTADPTGAPSSQSLGQTSIMPNNTTVTATVTSGGNNVSNPQVNYKPDSTMSVTGLQAILANTTDPALVSLLNTWINEFNATGSYTTYGQMPYTNASGTLTMSFPPGVWDYNTSATGYYPSSDSTFTANATTCSGMPGCSFANNMTLIPVNNTKVARIYGKVVVVDTLTSGTSNTYGQGGNQQAVQGLITVLLNNNNIAGQPVALVTQTDVNGIYEFSGNHVILSASLTTDTARVNYAVAEYQKFLGGASSAVVSNTTDPLYTNNIAATSSTYQVNRNGGGQYLYFQQGSFSAYIVDPLGHITTTQVSLNNASAVATIADPMPEAAEVMQLTTVSHLPRRTITGTVTDAFSTGNLSGVTVTLCSGLDAGGNCIPVRRDADTLLNVPRTSANADIAVASTTTAANGTYSFSNLDPGTYIVQLSSNGFISSSSTIIVPSSSTGLTNGNTVVVSNTMIADGPKGNLTGLIKLSTGANYTGSANITLTNINTGAVFGPTPNTGSTYSAFNLTPGEYNVLFQATGYVDVTGYVMIQGGVTTNYDLVVLVPTGTAAAAISGTVTNAVNGAAISGATVRIRAGMNITTGAYVAGFQAITSSNGSYSLASVPAGDYTLEVTASGFVTTYRVVTSAGASTPANQNVQMSPILNATEMRIVLSWSNLPKDLDSVMQYGYTGTDGSLQTDYNKKSVLSGYLTLDKDVTGSYGPETITVKDWTYPGFNGKILQYSVHNYTCLSTCTANFLGDTTKPPAQAVVRVYKQQGLVRTFVPTVAQVSANGTGRWWRVFCFDPSTLSISDAGTTACPISSFTSYYTTSGKDLSFKIPSLPKSLLSIPEISHLMAFIQRASLGTKIGVASLLILLGISIGIGLKNITRWRRTV
ncbi:MAG: carboxypeptidase regulatory-like domain-containing protein [Leptospiraceae bacterium]|nr:carboxypeptidase regulatory-like domain-containing protein [Leptospiraceae bacterium]